MSKILLVALLLATPLAAADGIDVNPPATTECSWDSGSEWTSDGYSSENYSYWWGRGYAYDGYACESRDDQFDGGLYANGNEIVEANAGSGSSYEHAWGETYEYDGHESWGYDWSSNGGSNQYSASESNEDSSGNDATVSTLVVDAAYADRCWNAESNSYGYGNAWSYSYNPYGWSSSDSSYERSSSTYDSGCARSVGAASNVTDASAGRDDSCDGATSSYSYSESWSSEWGSNSDAGSSTSSYSSCDAVFFANLGNERATVGSTNDCTSGSYTEDEPYWNGTYSYTYDDCATRTGVFGPTALGIYIEENSEHYEQCYPDGSCDASDYQNQALVVEHAYTGRTVWYLA